MLWGLLILHARLHCGRILALILQQGVRVLVARTLHLAAQTSIIVLEDLFVSLLLILGIRHVLIQTLQSKSRAVKSCVVSWWCETLLKLLM